MNIALIGGNTEYYSRKKMEDSPTLLYNCVLLIHMRNTVSFPLVQEKKKSGYGHLPYFQLKLPQALIKIVLFVEPEIIPSKMSTSVSLRWRCSPWPGNLQFLSQT